MSSAFFFFAIVFHSLVESLVIGILKKVGGIINLTLAIAMH